MASAASRRVIFVAVLLPAAVVWLTGITWGLPSRRSDRFLFGDRIVWPADQILAQAGGWDPKPTQASDHPQKFVAPTEQPREVNDDDAGRAQLALRYRLYSFQPDEMVTFRALSRMRPGSRDLDPRMYQYGGLWFYPIGALLKIGSKLGVVHVTTRVVDYVEHPELFARFYLVARLYVVAWALVAAWAVYRIAYRLCGGWAAPISALLCFALLPVVVNMSHEAKPHLPGMALVLLAVLAAASYVQTGRRRAAARAGLLCGAAMGMILTGGVSIALIPVMVFLRRDSLRRRAIAMVIAFGAMILCYAITNPYVILHLLHPQSVLAENVSNYGNFYNFEHQSGAAANTLRLIAEGASPGILAIAAMGLLFFFLRGVRLRFSTVTPLAWLLMAPAAATGLQVLLFAAGKPGEYGRFALLTDIALAIAAVRAATFFIRLPALRTAIVLLLPLCAVPAAFRYLANFLQDSGPYHSRTAQAAQLSVFVSESDEDQQLTLATTADPAPYCLPPVDLFRWRIIQLPKGLSIDDGARLGLADVLIAPVDDPITNAPAIGGFAELPRAYSPVYPPTLISWAGKPFRVLIRKSLLPQASSISSTSPERP